MLAVLAGNPNAGKTTLFNSLTKSRLSTGNWHGVTTRPSFKTVKGVTYADVPGMYSFDGYSMEEASAADEIKRADIVVNVVDGLTLESSLNLTRRIISMNKKTVVYLTKLKTLKRRGGRIDKEKLSLMLGVPVAESEKELKSLLKSGVGFAVKKDDKIALNQAYYGGNCNLTKAEKVIYNSYIAPFIFIAAILLMFFLAFFPEMPGEYLKGITEDLICVKFRNLIESFMPQSKISSLVCDGIIGGAGGVLSFIPQLAVLYIFLIILDESGIMSALSFVTDGVFQKVNLSGRAAFSLISGFGCTAAAILTTRGFTAKTTQKRTVASLCYIPCGAKLPVFLTFL
ncbi:MAG: 50S ribosome-binding GTPase, partial [Clostridia bacterium]|nr:50S ribosome-binding GTPase [Clostridia bacterium]